MKTNNFKILAIGNSFSDDAFMWLDPILNSLGFVGNVVDSLYIGGCSIGTHFEKAMGDLPDYILKDNHGDRIEHQDYKMSTALKLCDWDIITIQQASGYSGVSGSYSKLCNLADYVKKLAPKARLLWNMTWAYESTSTHNHFSFYDCDQIKMYNSIVDTVKTVVLPSGIFTDIIPIGTAIQNARTSFVGDNITRDGFHLSYDFGRYIAALTVASIISGKSIKDITYRPNGVDLLHKKVAIESVQNAIKKPLKITKSIINFDI